MNLDNISYLVDPKNSLDNIRAKLQLQIQDKLILQLRVYLYTIYKYILLAESTTK